MLAISPIPGHGEWHRRYNPEEPFCITWERSNGNQNIAASDLASIQGNEANPANLITKSVNSSLHIFIPPERTLILFLLGCLDQFLCMAFAQLTYRESLRDIEACLRGAKPKLYHMGIRSKVSRNTIAHANETRDWRIYADFAQVLIKIARELYAEEDFGLELDQTVYAFDSTILDLCLSVFPWATFRKGKAGHRRRA